MSMIDSCGGFSRGLANALSGCVLTCALLSAPLALAEEDDGEGQMPSSTAENVIQENVSGQIARPQSATSARNDSGSNGQTSIESVLATSPDEATAESPQTPTLPPAAKADNSIYRCVQDGVPTWQQQPCHQGDAPVTLDESLTVVPAGDVEPLETASDASAERLAREKERTLAAREESQRQYRIRKAIDDGYLVEGMSEAQAISVLGRPSDVNETISDNTHCRLLNWWEDVRVQFCDDEAISISASQ